MEQIKISDELKLKLIELQQKRNITLEGNITKLIDGEGNIEFETYLKDCISQDKDKRRKRLDLTKTLQAQNTELTSAQDENDTLMKELKAALESAEISKDDAMNQLDVIQRKQQTKLISTIVRIALTVIVGVGVITTVMYGFAIAYANPNEVQMIGSTWSNMFGILLTNAFSIVGTIMGVKYANKDKSED